MIEKYHFRLKHYKYYILPKSEDKTIGCGRCRKCAQLVRIKDWKAFKAFIDFSYVIFLYTKQSINVKGFGEITRHFPIFQVWDF